MKKFNLIAVIAIMCAFISGCSVGAVEFNKGSTYSNREMVGLPYFASLTGSSTPINKTQSLTALHVAKGIVSKTRIIAEFPDCDIALISSDNSDIYIPPLARAQDFVPVQTFGFSSQSYLPVMGQGKLNGVANYLKCKVRTAKAGAMQGMSGGPVVQNGAIVGIIVAINIKRDEVFFVEMGAIKKWLQAENMDSPNQAED